MESEYAFCPECGTPVDATAASVERTLDFQEYEQLLAKPNVQAVSLIKQLSKKAKIVIGSGIVVVALLISAYFLGKYFTDEQRILDRFDKAVSQGNPDKLLSLLASSNEDVKLDRNTADGIVQYLGSNRESFDRVKKQLASEAELLKNGDATSFENDNDAAFVYLRKKDKKRWLLYNDYELKVKRYMLPVRTNFEGAKIIVNGKESATASGDGSVIEIGPLLPGDYEIKSVYEGEYTTLESKSKVALFPLTGDYDGVDLQLQGDYVNVYANNGDARIVINGKDIGLNIGAGQQIGPIAIDGTNKMYVEADYPWGKMQSEELSIDSDRLEFDLTGLNDAVKDELMNSTHEFVASWMEAFQARDAGVLKHVHPDRVKDFADYFANMIDSEESYKGNLNKMTFDLDGFDVNSYKEGIYTVTVKVQVDYSEIFYYDSDQQEPVPNPRTNYTQYELQYVDGQWLVSNWGTSYDVGTENTKVFE
ncbi:hypothetical protein D7Z26_20255 [Cohnella endophytica]|uniref:PEGA domain-containing protein n=2 Tax=Cohnella endophytica TaxID=2419778 RepID=A0A494XHN0_9BACL|nr:hypothetical protein D7Z26_20255 [Cohnella endophytica]